MHARSAIGLLVGLVIAPAAAAFLTVGSAHTPPARRSGRTGPTGVATDLADVAASQPDVPAVGGTGIVISPGGIVLTNNHVIEGSTRIRVTNMSTAETYGARVVGYDVAVDLAVLRLIGATHLPYARLRTFVRARIGTRVTAVASGRRTAAGRITATGASIVEFSRLTGAHRRLFGLLTTSAPIRPGFSGGPLVGSAQHVVGMDVAFSNGHRRDRGFAIPGAVVRKVAREVLHHRRRPGAHIGPTAGLDLRVTPANSIGAVVVGLSPAAPLALAGLSVGDVIVTVTGAGVRSVTDLNAALDHLHPGDVASVAWLTPKGRRSTAVVKLGVGPPA
ncbi:MAG TPA: S1C family serine protease [Acidimicrobiales bacterium]|nr:S1C family serine protease [Acidimicrobiales bacterium]